MSRRKFVNRLVPIVLVVLMLGTVLAPCVSSEPEEAEKRTLTIWMQGNDTDDYFNQLEVEKEQVDEIELSFNSLMVKVEEVVNNDDKGPNGEVITEIEWDEIKASTYQFITLIKETVGLGFPFWEAINLIGTVIGFLVGPFYFLRQPIFSVGFGFSVIPFYFYETFLGRLFRPMWITYLPGFTSTYHINPMPPRIPYVRVGLHRIRSMLYNGLYIDFSDLGRDRPLGITLLIGYGFTLMA
jgi:hypothetical protein